MRLRLSPPLAAMMLAAILPAGWQPGVAMGQSSPWLYQAWQTDDGLAGNAVTGAAQTQDRYLWVATLGGLMRFNGAEFKAMSLPNLPAFFRTLSGQKPSRPESENLIQLLRER